jgi:hypothetical protein
MEERGILWGFVRRHPFVSRSTLDALYGQDIVATLLKASEPWLRVVEAKGAGKCYGERRESLSSLMDLRRAEVARLYALRVMGREAVLASVVPGFEADGEFFWKDRWWRLWVDPGGCAPEALGFVESPPKEFGDEVQDLIVTQDAGRMDSLARQVELTWGGGKKVFVMHSEGSLHRVARPRSLLSRRRQWKPYGKEELEAHIRQRQRGSHKQGLLASVAKSLDEVDWSLLVEAGNNPLMTRYELAYLQTDVAERMRETIDRLAVLEEAGLLETARSPVARDRAEQRKVLSTLGLEMLAANWGTTVRNMVRMHPWPQVVDRRTKRPRYGVTWLEAFGEHHRLVRQFSLALVHGGRSVSNNLGEAHVRVATTIGSRLLYRQQRASGENRQSGVVKPDGLVGVRIDQRGWLDGDATGAKTLCEQSLWVEIDRGRVHLGRLTGKLDGYGRIWESLRPMKPALVWVIDGSPGREAQVLELMRERGIDGWTVRLERLVLAEDDLWWLRNVPVAREWGKSKVGLRYDAFGGMAPWREIWRTTSGLGERPLLGVQPWSNRELRRSPPRKGEQAWIRHKSG